MKLYEISKEIEALMEQDDFMNAETGEIISECDFEAFSALLDSISMKEEEKLDNLGCMVKSLIAEEAAMKAEADKLAKRRESKKKKIENLKKYIANHFQATGRTKFETPRVVFSFRTSASVEIFNEELANEYAEEHNLLKIKTEIDKAKIKDLIKCGELDESFARIVSKKNLQIK